MIFGDIDPNFDPKSVSKKLFFFSYLGLIIVAAIELLFSFAELILALDDSAIMLFFYISLGVVALQIVIFAIAYISNLRKPITPFDNKSGIVFKTIIRVLSISVAVVFMIVGAQHLDISFYAYSLMTIGFAIAAFQIPSTVFSIIKATKKPANPLEDIFNFTDYSSGVEIENVSSSNNTADAIEVEVRDINED